MGDIETVKDDDAVAAEESAATKSNKFYAWSTFKRKNIRLGEEVTAKKLDISDEEFSQHVKSGSIRAEKYPISKAEMDAMGNNVLSVRDYHMAKLKELNPDI